MESNLSESLVGSPESKLPIIKMINNELNPLSSEKYSLSLHPNNNTERNARRKSPKTRIGREEENQ